MQNRIRRLEALCLFAIGGSGYCTLELIWRGFSHWTMFLAGGAALCWLAWLDARPRCSLLRAGALGAVGVTALELASGLLCTRLLHVTVWNYSAEWANLGGLICPRYSLLWLGLCLWVLLAMRWSRHICRVCPSQGAKLRKIKSF